MLERELIKEETMSKIKQASPSVIARSASDEAISREGLPKEAFAIVGDPQAPETWKLPHHTKTISRALQGSIDTEKTVDWNFMPEAVAALSLGGYQGERVRAEPGEIIKAAQHLAGHYQKAGKSVPDTLGAII